MDEKQKEIIHAVSLEVMKELKDQESGHDWFHVMRVWKNAKMICIEEDVDQFVVELGALLHDIADWKFHDGDETVGPRKAREILEQHAVAGDVIDQVCDIISTISYCGVEWREMNSMKKLPNCSGVFSWGGQRGSNP